jgi:uncharacterized protein YjbI with pentapeptide repeats
MQIPNETELSEDDIVPDANLRGADLSGSKLKGADLSGANLYAADLSGADLRKINLSQAYLREADFSGGTDLRRADLSDADLREANLSDAYLGLACLSDANLRESDLSGANLGGANVSGSDLFDADLSGANLSGATLENSELIKTNFSEADMVDVNISGVSLSRRTQIQFSLDELKTSAQSYGPKEEDFPAIWDAVARMNHELKDAYSENGLIGRARIYRVRERISRRREAKTDDTRRGDLAWFGSVLSRVVTGYGVQIRWIASVMIALYFVSAAIYWLLGMGVLDSLYYSIVTFTTSPPEPPHSPAMRIIAGIETFTGTLLTVFLGYVLGTREKV